MQKNPLSSVIETANGPLFVDPSTDLIPDDGVNSENEQMKYEMFKFLAGVSGFGQWQFTSTRKKLSGTVHGERPLLAGVTKLLKERKNLSAAPTRLAVLRYSIVPRSRNCRRLHFFVIVHVRPTDKLIREQWRRTYGQLQREHNFNIIFVTGFAHNGSLDDELKAEASLYGDILQAQFHDTYRNLTLKNIAALRFVAAMCPTVQAVVKLDDDVAWNIEGTKSTVDESIKDGYIRCIKYVSLLTNPFE
ncbi:hypothetical protein COOONC_04342 [Cooperia oncophora]